MVGLGNALSTGMLLVQITLGKRPKHLIFPVAFYSKALAIKCLACGEVVPSQKTSRSPKDNQMTGR